MSNKLYILWRHDTYEGKPRHKIVTTQESWTDALDFKHDLEDLNSDDPDIQYSIEEVAIHPEHCPVCGSHNWDYGHYEHMLTCCDCGKIFSKG